MDGKNSIGKNPDKKTDRPVKRKR
ncbi:hypothetical protein LCGC14_2990040, partial [marine sediment metagenome]